MSVRSPQRLASSLGVAVLKILIREGAEKKLDPLLARAVSEVLGVAVETVGDIVSRIIFEHESGAYGHDDFTECIRGVGDCTSEVRNSYGVCETRADGGRWKDIESCKYRKE